MGSGWFPGTCAQVARGGGTSHKPDTVLRSLGFSLTQIPQERSSERHLDAFPLPFMAPFEVRHHDCTNYWVCSHTGPLRIELAIQRLGWDFDFYARRAELAAHAYCSACGRFRPTFRLGWKTRPATFAGTHGSGAVTRSVLESRSVMPEWHEPADWKPGGAHVRRFGPGR